MDEKLMGSAVILAGGDSKRFGYPKAFLKLGNKMIIELIINRLSGHFAEIIVVTDQPAPLSHLPVKITGDIITKCAKSSLRGLHAGLSASSNQDNFVLACDMPFIKMDLIRYMHSHLTGYDAVIPRLGSYLQPLHAFYDKSCVNSIEKNLQEGKYKISELYGVLKIEYIDREIINFYDPEQIAFFNVNNYDDYIKARDIYRNTYNYDLDSPCRFSAE